MKTDARVNAVAGTTTTHGELRSEELARGHYENFSIAAFFLPKRLRQDLFNIYAFCRIADDIADECPDENQAADSLERMEKDLESILTENADNPLFSALAGTVKRNDLSLNPFRKLLKAFRMDLDRKRWETWDDLRHYTRHSADPVGHIVLELFGYRNPDYFALSDKICTALQLANHWQDVSEDWNRGRIYIPLEDLKIFGVKEEEIADKSTTDRFRELMTFEVERARRLFLEGFPLLCKVAPKLRLQLALYWCGGMEALNAIERVNYDVLNRSTKLTVGSKIKVVCKALYRWL
ncbi:squalene synthase HpnC [bacterium]|nr:squalene synthase HpnC [bacterium]